MTDVISGTSFPAIKGIQADTEFYTVMCPLKRLKRIFTFDESTLPVKDRAQRILNLDRIPEISNYILENRDSYVFSALTACIDGETEFTPIGKGKHQQKIGTLTIDDDAEVYITDGQHRNAAINEALKQDPSLGEENISVVFFVGKSLPERQKIFKDLNLYPVKTDSSLSITYDGKPDALLSKNVVFESKILSKLIHMENSNLGKRSKKLVSHSALNKATKELFDEINESTYKEQTFIAREFWEHLVDVIPAWQLVYKEQVSGGEIREESIHAYSVTFQALGIVGYWLLKNDPSWKKTTKALKDIDWSRNNKEDWEGRCVVNGAMRNSSIAMKLTANRIKHYLSIPLSTKEKIEETKFTQANQSK
ncbi:DNA sulfur modification protein DndB [Photobacterium kishitanii]|uniref:DNA sulfur modification protein DndB n=1 Tax=Photobacterium kishitanii TaxID=318456 RepID=A0A2T3KJ16_9GAMM|nr:DNA sulfur modification protein DndB [Photobacterium kishitanii]PSU99250.1 DNA sulfur modification protein DndB [Photobacterium kishitanii]